MKNSPKMAQICENGKTKFDLIKPKYNELWTPLNLTCQTLNSLESRFICQNQTPNLFKPLQKARTLNLFCQKWTEPRAKSGKTELQMLPNPSSSTKPELQTYRTRILQKSQENACHFRNPICPWCNAAYRAEIFSHFFFGCCMWSKVFRLKPKCIFKVRILLFWKIGHVSSNLLSLNGHKLSNMHLEK